jgi:hypothetical protein
MAPQPVRNAPAPAASEGMIIPYDHAATFELTGSPGNIVQDVINVASDGVFVAVAIGYGFEEQRARPINNPAAPGLAPNTTVIPGDVTLSQLPLAALIEGFRVNPKDAPLVFTDSARLPGVAPGQVFLEQPLASELVAGRILERIKTPEDISFFFSIVDSATGREFQDQPAHNLASLGKSNGERPFRLLARPLSFLPRSTLRLQISERTEGARGTLFIVLYGYKVLGAAACAEPVVRGWRAGPQGCPVETFGEADARAIPFDYVTTFELTGNPGAKIEDEVSVNVEGGFVATSIGYGLAVEERGVTVEFERISEVRDVNLRSAINAFSRATPIDLNQFPLRLFPKNALLDGIRIRPNFLRVALGNNGALADQLPGNLADKIFEVLNRPEDVSFRYAIFDGGTGHELQNRPLNNVAGLGIANGDRPFKKLARPMSFLPRSTIRVQVEEQFGRGTLFIAFQGYKLLNASTQAPLQAPRQAPRQGGRRR